MTIRRLTVAFACSLALFGLWRADRAAAAEQFPYQAVVIGEQVEVRCGPGGQFYATSMAKANDQVTVHRHDHGGWYMISPPAGSFSWIDASLVNPIGGNRGLVTISPGSGQPPRAIVRIGSQLSDDHSFFGRELSNGDEVTILGEKVLAGRSGAVRMLKIVPPAQEFRWIKGEFLVPMSQQIQQQIAVDPYQVPAEHRHQHIRSMPVELASGTLATPAASRHDQFPQDAGSISTAGLSVPTQEMKMAALSAPQMPTAAVETPSPATLSASHSRKREHLTKLHEIDQKYSEMMARDPSEWDLAPVAQAYRELQQAADPSVSPLVAQRLEVVARRQEIAQHYQKFVQISEETSRRDAQLLAQRTDFPTEPLSAPPVFMPPVEDPSGMNSVPVTGPEMSQQPVTDAPAGVTPQLNGAGIIQPVQAPPGFPAYILVAPNGRMLAYVEAGEGVSLEPWVGKPAGLIGMRSKEANLGADLIRAQKIISVKLSQ